MSSKISKNQGTTENGNKFGYIHGEDGGYFFTWLPTLEETLASVEVDEVDGNGDLTRDQAVEILRAEIESTFAVDAN